MLLVSERELPRRLCLLGVFFVLGLTGMSFYVFFFWTVSLCHFRILALLFLSFRAVRKKEKLENDVFPCLLSPRSLDDLPSFANLSGLVFVL